MRSCPDTDIDPDVVWGREAGTSAFMCTQRASVLGTVRKLVYARRTKRI